MAGKRLSRVCVYFYQALCVRERVSVHRFNPNLWDLLAVIAVAVVGELPYSAHLKVSKNTKAKKIRKQWRDQRERPRGHTKGISYKGHATAAARSALCCKGYAAYSPLPTESFPPPLPTPSNSGTACDKCGTKYFNYFKRFMALWSLSRILPSEKKGENSAATRRTMAVSKQKTTASPVWDPGT